MFPSALFIELCRFCAILSMLLILSFILPMHLKNQHQRQSLLKTNTFCPLREHNNYKNCTFFRLMYVCVQPCRHNYKHPVPAAPKRFSIKASGTFQKKIADLFSRQHERAPPNTSPLSCFRHNTRFPFFKISPTSCLTGDRCPTLKP